ncbi:beta-ketoacyl synthase N-terminal-like domain-containing protein [Plantactinospora sp. ZYX-F-223]|uniref:beta-ketoacyl synthase N-terminal-like domain-containing protein n=1 Tax=Plantactinospora sp. ZYX-F-223 TaxID=3144103 RepID=UPI0031FBE375
MNMMIRNTGVSVPPAPIAPLQPDQGPRQSDGADDGDIAIIGLVGRFPGASNIEQYWKNLRNGVETVARFDEATLAAAGVPPQEYRRRNYVRAGARSEGIDLFDADFFGYSRREAEIMDPQHRWFLESCWEALEHSGYDPANLDSVGVFGAATTSAYLANVFSNLDNGASIRNAHVGIGNELGYLTTRVSYKLDLTGPSYPVQTACSSSLVAVHLACQSLLNFECDIALGGGVAFKVPPGVGYAYQSEGILSPDGRCRPFDIQAQGTIFNNGIGVVVLKRLADALADRDTVYAVIRGSAVNNDGAAKASFSAPGIAGQTSVILDALVSAGVEASTISYVEAHGSGTRIGDAIEVKALTEAYRQTTERRQFCGIGSVKSNIGHLDVAAGIAGLIKTVLALKHEELPPTLHYTGPNADIDFAGSPFRVQAEAATWMRTAVPRRAGVSAFGFGGTNAHVILQEAPDTAVCPTGRASQLLVLSARSPGALEHMTDRLAERLRDEPLPLADVAYTLALGRRDFPHRRVLVTDDSQSAVHTLQARDPVFLLSREQQPKASVAFLCGLADQQDPGVADELFHSESVFRNHVEACLRGVPETDAAEARQLISGEGVAGAGEQRSAAADIALFAVQYAMAQLWRSWGVEPAAVLSYGIGDLVAGSVVGAFEPAVAAGLVGLRATLLRQAPASVALSVDAGVDVVAPLLADGARVLARHGADECVVGGTAETIAAVVRRLNTARLRHRRVKNPGLPPVGVADEAVQRFASAAAGHAVGTSDIPWVSGVTGMRVVEGQAGRGDFWQAHLTGTADFGAGVVTLMGNDDPLLLQIGPGRSLMTIARRAARSAVRHIASLPGRHDGIGATESTQRALGQLWSGGQTVDWTAYYAGEQRHRVGLPTYPFERQRYWLEPGTPQPAREVATAGPHPLLDRVLVRTMDQAVYATEFALDRHWVLAEHRMLGEAIVPGTTYLEIARSAAADYLGRPVTLIRDVEFLVPLLVRDGEVREAHTIIRRLDVDTLGFSVVSKNSDEGPDDWTLHARGCVGWGAVRPAPAQRVQAVLAECDLARVDVGRMQAEHPVMNFGGRWKRSLTWANVGDRQAVGQLALPEEYRAECAELVLHPALLDLATGFTRWALLSPDADPDEIRSDQDLFLPLGYERMELHRALPPDAWSYVRPCPGTERNGEIRRFDIVVFDTSDTAVLDIKGFTVKRVRSPKQTVNELRGESAHHSVRWVRADDTPPVGRLGRVLLITLPDVLPAGTVTCMRDLAETFTQAAPVGSAAEYEDMLAAGEPTDIIFATPGAPFRPAPDVAEQLAPIDAGVVSLFHLAKALAVRGSRPIRLTVVSSSVHQVRADEQPTSPAAAAAAGLAKVIGHEHDNVRCGWVDVDAATPPEAWLGELSWGADQPTMAAYRDGRRYLAELVEQDLAGDGHLPVGSDGAWLITGGLGGLGLEMARYLARSVPGVRLALLSRSGLPDRATWDDPEAAHTDRQRRQMAVIRELEAVGAVVRTYAAHVDRVDDMRVALAAVLGEFGRIGAVVHAAGIAGDGFVLRKDAEVFRRTLAPKVDGSVILDVLTRDHPPEIMVLFSSTTALFGAAGQSDYTAANMFQDAFAEFRNAQGRRTVTINWTDWIGTGMADAFGVERDRGFFRSITIADAVASLDRILRAAPARVIVGEINYGALAAVETQALRTLLRRAPVRMPSRVGRRIGAMRQGPSTAAAVSRDDDPPIILQGRESGTYTSTEDQIARAWGAELGRSEMDVTANVFDLGGDSLLALRIVHRLERSVGKVTLAEFFANPTVADLARFLDGRGTT